LFSLYPQHAPSHHTQALHDECLRGAKFVSRLLEALGAEVKMAQPYDGKNPVVLGRLGNNPAHPTGMRSDGGNTDSGINNGGHRSAQWDRGYHTVVSAVKSLLSRSGSILVEMEAQ
jgi:hypothetical protein